MSAPRSCPVLGWANWRAVPQLASFRIAGVTLASVPLASVALASVAPSHSAEASGDGRIEAVVSAFVHGEVEATALLDALCARIDRRSLAAMCDDDPATVLRGFKRRRCAHWAALGPDALRAAARNGTLTPGFARRMRDECRPDESRTDSTAR